MKRPLCEILIKKHLSSFLEEGRQIFFPEKNFLFLLLFVSFGKYVVGKLSSSNSVTKTDKKLQEKNGHFEITTEVARFSSIAICGYFMIFIMAIFFLQLFVSFKTVIFFLQLFVSFDKIVAARVWKNI